MADRLKEALELNRPLAAAYYTKEDLRQAWRQPDKKTARDFLIDWIYRAGRSGVSMLVKMARTVAIHLKGILAYYDYPISTGPLEGTNKKIKTMKRQAYGFRDHEFFKLKIMALHESKYVLTGNRLFPMAVSCHKAVGETGRHCRVQHGGQENGWPTEKRRRTSVGGGLGCQRPFEGVWYALPACLRQPG